MRHKGIKKILLIRLRSLGDLVVITPCTRAVKQTYPESKLAVLVEKGMEDLFLENPYVDEVITLNKDISSISYHIKFMANLFKQSFDMVINLHGGPRSCIMVLCSGASYRVGGLQKKHHFNWVFNIRVSPFQKILGTDNKKDHMVTRHLATLHCAGIKCGDDNSLLLKISKENTLYVDQLLTEYAITNNRIAIMHCRAPGQMKKLNKNRVAHIADSLIKHFNLSIIFTGGVEEKTFYQEVKKEMNHAAHNLAGMTTVGQLAALCKRSLFFLGVDSGPAHVAAAVGTYTISLFGSTGVTLWHPWTSKGIILRKAYDCIGCGKGTCPYGEFPKCLNTLTTEEIITAIKQDKGLSKAVQETDFKID